MDQTIKPVVVGILERDGKYLFTFRTDIDPEDVEMTKGQGGIWQLPGGSLEFGEDCEECLIREMREEVGIDVIITRLLPKIYSDIRNNVWHGLIISYLCSMKNPNDTITINDEASDYKWLSYEEAKKVVTFPFTIEGLEIAEKIRKNL